MVEEQARSQEQLQDYYKVEQVMDAKTCHLHDEYFGRWFHHLDKEQHTASVFELKPQPDRVCSDGDDVSQAEEDTGSRGEVIDLNDQEGEKAN